jgi:hypothetical protein
VETAGRAIGFVIDPFPLLLRPYADKNDAGLTKPAKHKLSFTPQLWEEIMAGWKIKSGLWVGFKLSHQVKRADS